MKILGILAILTIVLLATASFTSGYICIQKEDNDAVKEFKLKINQKALEEDFENGLSVEQVKTKLKYFNPCKW